MKTKERNRILFFCIGFMLVIGLSACKKESKPNGFILQKFKIINNQLNSLINSIKDSAYISKEANNVIILELGIHDSAPEFCFTSTKKDKLNEYFIFSSNSRIVGYIEDKSRLTEIIVLSDINNLMDFEMIFYKFLIPTKEKKYFEYIYFPDDQYIVKENGKGYPPPFFDPYFYYYTYKGNRIVPVIHDR